LSLDQALHYGLFKELARYEVGSRPPIDQWHPDRVIDIDMVIDREGNWLFEGTPILRPRLVRLFSSILRRSGNEFHLVTPVEACRISVEEVPFMVVLAEIQKDSEAQKIVFTTNVGDVCVLGPQHGLRVGVTAECRGMLYLDVRDGLEAKLNRSSYYAVMDAVETHPRSGALVVKSENLFFDVDVTDSV